MNYQELRNRIVELSNRLRTFDGMSEADRRTCLDELSNVVNGLLTDLDQFKTNVLWNVPHSMLEDSHPSKRATFITTPFQLH